MSLAAILLFIPFYNPYFYNHYMTRYFLHIAYDGSKYRGWQRQTDVISVQEIIEDKLLQIFKEKITVYGCGRTDAGVHASQYILHINLATPLTFDLKFRLNKNLPDGIVIHEVVQVENRQHARFDAIARTYHYFMHFDEDCVLKRYSTFQDKTGLDFKLMKEAAALIVEGKDFKHFCKQPELFDDTTCNVFHASLAINEAGKRMQFKVTANRFLRGMIRILVAALIDIGSGKLSIEAFKKMLQNEGEPFEKHPAYPNGLYLSKVEYPYISFEEKGIIGSLLKIE